MYEKIKEIGKSLDLALSSKFFKHALILGGVIIFFLCIYMTYSNKWDHFKYPKEEYKLLEEEAFRLASNHTFDTKYHYTITNYDPESKVLIFDLTDETSTNIVTVTVTIDNYNDKDESIDIERETNNTFFYITKQILAFILIPIAIAFMLVLGIYILYSIFWLIAFIIHISIKYLKDKR